LVAAVGIDPETFLNINLGYNGSHFYSKAAYTYAERKPQNAEK
jgi:hypothetical protein